MNRYEKFVKEKASLFLSDFSSLGNIVMIALFAVIYYLPVDKFLLIVVGLALNETICSIIKLMWHKTRPNGQKYSNMIEKLDAGSFPSIHSSRIMFLYMNLILDSSTLALKLVFAAVILLVGISRVHIKKHYTRDVIGGYIIGFIVFYVINFLL